MKRSVLSILALALVYIGSAQNKVPQISNFNAQYSAPGNVLFSYDLKDAENDPSLVELKFSTDGGVQYEPANNVTGQVGAGINAGTNKTIQWKIPDTLLQKNSNLKFKLVASDGKPIDIQQLINQVDTNKMRKDLEFIQGIRHRTAGKAHLAVVQDSLARTLRALGLDTTIHRFVYSAYDAQNIIGATRTTEDEAELYILCAHYDSVNNAPGADDNGSGVVGMNEVARILSPYAFKKKIKFIGFDLEEAGLIGSQRYLTQKALLPTEKLQGVLDYEMIGFYSESPNTQQFPTGFNLLFPAAYNQVANDQFKGNFITNVANTFSDPLRVKFDQAAATYVKDLKVVSIAVPGNGAVAADLRRSDHAPFWDAGYAALMLTDGANFRNLNYHTAKDSIHQLNFTFMGNVVKTTIAMLAEAAEIAHAGTAQTSLSLLLNNTLLTDCALRVYPNPVANELTIDGSNCEAISGELKISDQTGRVLFQKNVSEVTIRIDTLHYPTGEYQIVLKQSNGYRIGRFTKQ